jgi:hypothetical protein
MKRITTLLPENWFSQSIVLVITSVMTFYLFRIALENNFVTLQWYQDETRFIYTFLILQFFVKAMFYWILPMIIGKYVIGKIQMQIKKSLSERKTIADLKALSEMKKSFVSFLGFTLKIGWTETSDYTDKIDLSNKDEEIKLVSKKSVQWVCILLHTLITLVVVENLSPFFMLPIFAVAIAGVIFVCMGIYIIIENFEFIERVRKEIAKPNNGY